MEVKMADSFFESFKRNVIDVRKPWKFSFWRNLYYDIKHYFWALFTYHKIVKTMYAWEGSDIYKMVKFQLEILLPEIENGHEEEVSRGEKVKDIKRFIELLDHYEKDDYMERCGYDHNWEWKFVPESEHLVSLETTETPEQKEKNEKAIDESVKLREKELEEMGELFKKIPTWWD